MSELWDIGKDENGSSRGFFLSYGRWLGGNLSPGVSWNRQTCQFWHTSSLGLFRRRPRAHSVFYWQLRELTWDEIKSVLLQCHFSALATDARAQRQRNKGQKSIWTSKLVVQNLNKTNPRFTILFMTEQSCRILLGGYTPRDCQKCFCGMNGKYYGNFLIWEWTDID